MKRFKDGDVVREKTGGPKMTVEEKHESGNCTCIWFRDGILLRKCIAARLLAKA